MIVITLAYQINLRERIELLGGSPDLRIVFLVFLSLSRGRVLALIYGFVGGLFLDALAPHTLGATALLGSVTGYLLGSVKAKLLIENPWVRAGIAVVLFCLWELLLFLFPSGGPDSLGNHLSGVVLPSAAYTFLLGLAFFWVVQRRGGATP